MRDSLKIIELQLQNSLTDSLMQSNKFIDSVANHFFEKTDSLTAINTTLRDSLINMNKTSLEANQEIDEVLGMPLGLAKIFIPVVVTLTVFALGQFLIWLKGKYEKKNEIQAYKDLILEWIQLIKPGVTQQVTSCNDFATRLSASVDIHPELFQYNKMLADKVDDISVDVYVNTFVTNLKVKNKTNENEKKKWCFNLISQFNFLKNIEEQIPKTYEKYHSQIFDIMAEWNENFGLFDKVTSEQSRLINATPTHPTAQFHASVMAIANAWVASSPNARSSATLTMTNLITPLTQAVKSELKLNPSNDYAFNLSDTLQRLRITHMKWSITKTGNVQVFQNLGTKIEEVIASLNTTRNSFENDTEIKNVFQIK